MSEDGKTALRNALVLMRESDKRRLNDRDLQEMCAFALVSIADSLAEATGVHMAPVEVEPS